MKFNKLLFFIYFLSQGLILALSNSCGGPREDVLPLGPYNQESLETQAGVGLKSLYEPGLEPQTLQGKDLVRTHDYLLGSHRSDFFRVEETFLEGETSFNFINHPEGLSEVVISGKDVVIEDHSKLGELIQKVALKKNVKILKINAQTVLVKKPVWVPSGTIEIRAQKVTFSHEGRLDTSGLQNKKTLSQSESGKKGTNAGDIKLIVEDIEFNREVTMGGHYFVLKGGDGQEGGPGSHGAKGRDVPVLPGFGHNGVVYRITESCVRMAPRHDFQFLHKRREGDLICTFKGGQGIKNHSTSGEDARAAGSPGLGGDGGNLYSTVAIPKELVLTTAGKSAQGGDIFKGGRAGTPHRSCFYWDSINDHYDRMECQETRAGRDIKSPVAKRAQGKDGSLELIKGDWVTEEALEMIAEYARERYLQGNFEEAKINYEMVAENFLKVKNNSILKGKVIDKLFLVRQHLDYFGNGANWVPKTSLEANIVSFEKDLKRSFETFYSHYFLKKRIESAGEKRELLRSEVEKLNFEQIKLSEKSNLLQNSLNLVHERIRKLQIQEGHFQSNLRKLEEMLRDQARQNIKIPNSKKAVALLGALSRSIPVGQPAFGLIGDSLDFLEGAFDRDQDLTTTFNKIPSLLSKFSKADFKKAAKEWNEAYQNLDLSQFSHMSPKERLEKLNDFNRFFSPLIKTSLQTLGDLEKREISQTRFNTELARLKSSHPVYKDISRELQQLVNEKKVLVKDMTALMEDYVKVGTLWTQTLETLHHMADDFNNTNLKFHPEVEKYIDRLHDKARERLLYSYYKLVKSFEYRSLKPFYYALNLEPLLVKVREMVEIGSEGELSEDDFRQLRVVYTERFYQMFEKLIGGQGQDFQRSYRWFYFSEEELKLLSKGKAVYINVADHLSDHSGKNMRLEKITIEEAPLYDIQNDPYFQGTFEIKIRPLNQSLIRNDSESFVFNYGHDKDFSHLTWGVAVNALSGQYVSFNPDQNWERDLWEAFNQISHRDAAFYTRIGVRNVLKVSLEKSFTVKDIPFELKRLGLKVQFAYQD